MFSGREQIEMEIAALVGSWLDDAVGIYPDGFTIRTFGLALEVEQPPEEEGGHPWSEIGFTCSDTRAWVQAGLFRRAMLAAEQDMYQAATDSDTDNGNDNGD